jgi:hypothetical protein
MLFDSVVEFKLTVLWSSLIVITSQIYMRTVFICLRILYGVPLYVANRISVCVIHNSDGFVEILKD